MQRYLSQVNSQKDSFLKSLSRVDHQNKEQSGEPLISEGSWGDLEEATHDFEDSQMYMYDGGHNN